MKPRLAAALVACLLLVPTAQAITVLSVPGTQVYEYTATDVVSDTYSTSFNPNVFTDPIYRGTMSVKERFGEVKAGTALHHNTAWLIVDDNAATTEVRIEALGTKSRFGNSLQEYWVYVNGTLAWRHQINAGVFGFTFNYEDTHILQYGENQTLKVGEDDNGDLIWDWTTAPDPVSPGFSRGGRLGQQTNVEGGALYWILPGTQASGEAFQPVNGSQHLSDRLWLANMSGIDTWTVNTEYVEKSADFIEIRYQFDSETTFFADIDNYDACFAPNLERLLTFCPTIPTVMGKLVGFFPSLLATFIGVLNPQLGGILENAGVVVSGFVSAWAFTTILILKNIPSVTVLVLATASGAANLGAALRGDFGHFWHDHLLIIKGLALLVFWYLWLMWHFFRFIARLTVQVFNMIGNYIPFT